MNLQDKPLTDIFMDVAREEKKRVVAYRPISPEEKTEVCTCGHLLRYHTPTGYSDTPLPLCKYYKNCHCKGYKKRNLRSLADRTTEELQNMLQRQYTGRGNKKADIQTELNRRKSKEG
jgi:hypothetical protein